MPVICGPSLATMAKRGRKKKRPSSSSPRPWDADVEGGFEQQVEANAAGEELVDLLIEMYLLGTKMTGKHLCLICYHASQAGVQAAKQHA
eukprot:2851147-Pyramimonas_sp.AAC.1